MLDPKLAASVDVTKYLQQIVPAVKQQEFRSTLGVLQQFHDFSQPTKLLEIGTGSGWFQILGLQEGIDWEGVELSEPLVESSKRLAAEFGLNPKISVGNIEGVELPKNYYDVIVATSVFEHVPDWQPCIEKIYSALKPGGIFYFTSTNKFSPVSGEYPKLPLYGWLPDKVRYWIRVRNQGPGIMLFGVDFHQFTFPGLRREFRRVGFSQVLDIVQMKNPEN
jgi:SAM-dependent methyltransferase